MKRLTTGDLASVIQKKHPVTTREMVADILDSTTYSDRNPFKNKKGWHFLTPQSAVDFLVNELDYSESEAIADLKSVGFTVFKQLALVAS